MTVRVNTLKRKHDWKSVNWKKRNVQIAAELGCLVEVVCAARRRLGKWDMATRKIATEAEKGRADSRRNGGQVKRNQIISLFESGNNVNEIGKKLDLTPHYVRHVLRKSKVGSYMERNKDHKHFIKRDERELIKTGAERVKQGTVSRSAEARRLAPQIGRTAAAVEREMYRIIKGHR